jgi:hypothetical protein
VLTQSACMNDGLEFFTDVFALGGFYELQLGVQFVK